MNERSHRILVVDDNPEVREFLLETLREGGYQSEGVADGLEAIDRLKAGGWELVLTDLQMPGLDGLALIRWLKENADQTPVILVTGSTDHPACAEAQAQGARCLHKPFQVDALLEAVGEVLGSSGGGNEPDPWETGGRWPQA